MFDVFDFDLVEFNQPASEKNLNHSHIWKYHITLKSNTTI